MKPNAPPAPEPGPIPIEVRNPRYKGATMEDVARALHRATGPRSRREPVRSDERAVGQTPSD